MQHNWKIKPINEFAKVITGGTPSTVKKEYWENGNIPWIPSGDLKDCRLFSAQKFITKKGLENSATKIMPKKTVLIALTGATTGQTALLEFDACANQSVTGILPSDEHIPEYLFYYLRTQRNKILKLSYGGAQKHISQGFVKELKIPLPSLSIQKRIVSTLESAEKLKEKRKQANELTSKLAQSIFLEMFGDPNLNKSNYELVEFKKVIIKIKEKHKTPQKDYLENGKYPIIDQGNRLIGGYTNSDKNVYFEGLPSIVFGDHTRIIKYIDFPFAQGADGTKIFRPNNWFNPKYFFYCIKLIKLENAGYSRHYKFLKNKNVSVPPKKLQDRFAEKVESIERLMKKQQICEKEISQLFDSLMQKAFNGELVS